MEYFTFTAEKEDKELRLDIFLKEELYDISRNRLQGLISEGDILVNGKAVNKNYRLREKDIIDVSIPDPMETDILPYDIPLDIIYEDSEIIVVNKPQNMVVHPAAGHYDDTLVNALLFHCGKSLSGINGKLRPGIVHRIDRDTSGVLVIAKTDNAHNSLALQLSAHSMTRVYNAVVYNNFKEDYGVVDKPIGRNPADRKKMAVTDKNSKRAVTHYKVLKRMGKFNFIELRLETGRTHQIRVHFSSVGHPLAGDDFYGGSLEVCREQALHCGEMRFARPSDGKTVELFCDIREDMRL